MNKSPGGIGHPTFPEDSWQYTDIWNEPVTLGKTFTSKIYSGVVQRRMTRPTK